MKGTLLLSLLIIFCNQPVYSQSAKIDWDEWGVPHITASNEKDLFFAQGWAEMEAHANLVLQLYGTARGKAAFYWGSQFESSDILIHNLNFPHIALSYRKIQNPELKQIIQSFINGMNAYAKAHPEAIEKDKQIVLPITPDDVNLQSLFVFVTRFTGGKELNQVAGWQDIGSNAIAIAAKRSASGNAMLIQNPHLPWNGEYTFFESELTLNGNPVYGAQILGFPGIAIGFNKNLGWTHTNNTLDNADSFELTLKDNGYLLDGKKLDFKARTDTIWIKQQNGSLLPKLYKFYSSIHGPVLKTGSKKALAVKLAGMDSPNALLEWWKMANSQNFNQFEAALKMQQIPFWNVIYADKQGNIFYLFNGLVPRRAYGRFEDWDHLIEGDSSKNIWKGYLSYEELPKLKNPKSGWLQNTNDPPWTATLPRELDKSKYPPYIAPDEMPLRSQRAANMLLPDSSITFEHLVDYKQSTHVLMADRVLDDLLSGIDNTSSPLLQEARQVLTGWDRNADNNSKGMLLFYAWAMAFNPKNDYNYAVRWNRDFPNSTPSGLRDKKHAVELLEQAAKLVKTTYGDLSTTWGTYLRLERNGINLPANGADGALGIFRVAAAQPQGKTTSVTAGDSWVGIIEFGKKVRAKVLLSYGNSSQKQSIHNGDQLKLFSEKKMRDAWFYPEKLKGHIAFTEVKKGEIFIRQ
ncbi:acylase [uncultured Mucilaginibacter sp.]|uniref:acylase n=1 Tax=uncultured Mucilaginibacter sp. TaxID=797541 RepID=UPI002630DDB9|nr:acylase [uncultured Mucilaginibacter sp.]